MKPESKQAKPAKITSEAKEQIGREESLIRILSTDISGESSVYVGLTNIKGVSWGFSNAVCNMLKIEKNRKIKDLSKAEIDKISAFIHSPTLPKFMLNRRKDIETAQDKHLITADLDLQKEFDIKRLRKIKSYRGIRHATGQPVRGQRTRSHFRKNKSVGVMKAKSKPGTK